MRRSAIAPWPRIARSTRSTRSKKTPPNEYSAAFFVLCAHPAARKRIVTAAGIRHLRAALDAQSLIVAQIGALVVSEQIDVDQIPVVTDGHEVLELHHARLPLARVNDDDILDAHAALARQIDAGLHRNHGVRHEAILGPHVEPHAAFVHVDADPMPGTVIVVVAVRAADAAHGGIDIRPRRRLRKACDEPLDARLQRDRVDLALPRLRPRIGVGAAQHDARAIGRETTFEVSTAIEQHQLAFRQLDVGADGRVVRGRTVRPVRRDRREAQRHRRTRAVGLADHACEIVFGVTLAGLARLRPAHRLGNRLGAAREGVTKLVEHLGRLARPHCLDRVVVDMTRIRPYAAHRVG